MPQLFVHQYFQRSYSSIRESSRLNTTWQAELYSGLVTSHAQESAIQKVHAFMGTRPEPRIEVGQEMTYGTSLERHI